MKTLFTTIALLITIVFVNAQDTIKLSDFECMNNTSWEGALTYKDYQSGNQETIPSKMQIKIEGDKIIYSIQYDYEPNKNNVSKVKIKKNGTYFGSEKVISFTEENGTKTLVTMYQGKDNGDKADMYMTRVLTDTTYSATKEVQIDGTDSRFVRNKYEYTKIK